MQPKIYYDLSESKYFLNYEGMTFYFSSPFNMKRFDVNADDYIKMESLKLDSKYHVKANYTLLLAIAFYKKIEKRGFRIEIDDKTLFENDIIFACINN